ncbi:MAG: hypothetical protein V2A54_02420 [Bacteroidota bacterium]
MNIMDYLNLTGLVLSMAGALVAFVFTPQVDSTTYVSSIKESIRLKKKDKGKNKMIRLGMIIMSTGFICQVVAFFCK